MPEDWWTTFSVAGLFPELMLAGAAGGWLALTYQEQAKFASRISRVLLSSLAATWGTPLGIYLLDLSAEPTVVKFPLAFGLGLITMDVLGSGVISMARRWFKERERG